MSRARAIVIAALLAATFGFAQDIPGNGTSGQSGNPTNQNSPAGQSQTIEGCLSSSAMGDNSFALTQDQSGKVYRLAGDSSALASHTGQQVRVSGAISGDERNSETNPSTASSAESLTFQVNAIEMISDHCTGHPSATRGGAGSVGTSQNFGASENTRKARADNNLPQTATILPLLGLVGLSSLVTGFMFRNR